MFDEIRSDSKRRNWFRWSFISLFKEEMTNLQKYTKGKLGFKTI